MRLSHFRNLVFSYSSYSFDCLGEFMLELNMFWDSVKSEKENLL